MSNEPQPHPEALVGIGFGTAEIRLDGETVYDGERRADTATGWDDFLEFRHAEMIARNHPDQRCEVAIHGPFSGCVWEWDKDHWHVTSKDGGFA